MKTAKEFLEETFRETGFHISNPITERMVIAAMQVYAEGHVTEALKSAAENAKISIYNEEQLLGVENRYSNIDVWCEVNKESILNCSSPEIK